ncbi:MAG: membrane-bound O-acyltransferase family protein [Croceibacter sp.]|jgi:D-alanyl-lipoteichoic acid acyltransferase DltB (MBOAT superfamily)|nr:membrane-bound O-acyltransferase family protein [Croceibacter sp.]
MLFNSIAYLVFLPVVFILFWSLRKYLKAQNVLLLIASYVFYAWWDYRFLGLIIASTLVDYGIGLTLAKTEKISQRKLLLSLSLVFNLGLLCVFKYYNFFIESFVDASHTIGFSANISSLNIILPVGISFYTFQTLSYTIDVYRKQMQPTQSLVKFATYVAFFPQLVAGPIERAKHLLPQFSILKVFQGQQAISGINLILWGLFKKIVIADNCATYVNTIFSNYENLNTLTLGLGAIYFAFQIYGDFSGYTDIAIGSARLLGFDLKRNFNYPYFSRDIAEFWRRWHISLSTWFRDYLYIPLGGSRVSKGLQLRNVMIVFLVSGFWHGANWTFLMWGFIHALLFIPLLYFNKNRVYLDQVSHNKILPSFKEFFQMLTTFVLVTLVWVFFRADTISEAFSYIKRLVSNLQVDVQYLSIERYAVELLLLIFIFLCLEWWHRKYEHPLVGKYKWVKITFVIVMLLTLGVYSNHQDFIYFQF